jgi:hypothetical protein
MLQSPSDFTPRTPFRISHQRHLQIRHAFANDHVTAHLLQGSCILAADGMDRMDKGNAEGREGFRVRPAILRTRITSGPGQKIESPRPLGSQFIFTEIQAPQVDLQCVRKIDM